MTRAAPEIVAGPGPDGFGNVLYRIVEPDRSYLLKLYRPRRTGFRSVLEPWFSRVALRRSGASPQARFESERENLAVWARAGFDVCRVFDRPLPAGLPGPGLWLEFCPGPTLGRVLADGSLEWSEKQAQLARFAEALGQRHERAFATGERRLLQKHGSADHVLLFETRRITIDLEGAYLPSHDMNDALVRETGGTLRSLRRALGARFDDGLDVFARHYPAKPLLRRALEREIHSPGVVRRIAQRRDRHRRGADHKLALSRRLLERFE